MAPSARNRRLRWFAPLAAAAVVALITSIPGLSSAATPSLAPLTGRQLLSKVQMANVRALSGTINLTTNLGIPDLSALSAAAGGGGQGQSGHGDDGQGFNPTALLAGSHKALVWFAGPDQSRIALLQDMAETDVVHNGRNIWTWDSTTKKVVHYTLPAGTATATEADGPADPVKTPQQVADDLLAHLSPSTQVSVGDPIVVAGQKAYQLVLAPHTAASTVDHLAIAIDGATFLPLQVEVFAKGQKAAAVKLGFGSISYATPAASRFSFTAPPGSTVTNKTFTKSREMPEGKPSSNTHDSSQPATVGQDWTTVAIVDHVQIPAQLGQYLNGATPVTGAFGHGRLLQSSLVNVVVLDDGRVAVGAVTASTLEAALAAAR